jgi:hypothetical protein
MQVVEDWLQDVWPAETSVRVCLLCTWGLHLSSSRHSCMGCLGHSCSALALPWQGRYKHIHCCAHAWCHALMPAHSQGSSHGCSGQSSLCMVGCAACSSCCKVCRLCTGVGTCLLFLWHAYLCWPGQRAALEALQFHRRANAMQCIACESCVDVCTWVF